MDAAEILEKAGVSFALATIAFLLAMVIGSVSSEWKSMYMLFMDVPETAASVKILGEHGFFGKVPELGSGEYYFFGSVPPLYAFLGSIVNYALNDPLASVLFLNAIVSILLAAIVLLNCRENTLELKILAILALLFNDFTGMTFPFVDRSRSLLSVFFLALMIYSEKTRFGGKAAHFACAFASAISQPITAFFGIALASWKIIIAKGDYGKIAAMALALIASTLFYHKLLLGDFEKSGWVLGSSVSSLVSISANAVFLILLFVALALLNGRKAITEFSMMLFLLSLPIVNSIAYLITGDVSKTLFVLIPMGSDLVYEVFLAPVLLVLLLADGAAIEKKKMVMTVLLFTASLGAISYSAQLFEWKMSATIIGERMKVVEGLEENAETDALAMMVVKSGGKIYAIHGDFIFPALSVLAGKNTVFAGNLIPPQLDRGKKFDDAMELINNLAFENGSRCENISAGLRKENVDVLLYIINSEKLRNTLAAEGEKCGLEILDFGSVYDRSAVIAYKITDDVK